MRVQSILLAGVVAGTGCDFAPGMFATTPDAVEVVNDADRVFLDARPDTPPDASCYGSGLLVFCYAIGQEPSGTYQPTANVNTDAPGSCDRTVIQGNGPVLCVKTVDSVTITADIRFSGSRPMVLLGASSVTIAAQAQLDLSEGAGANTGTCSGPGDGRDNVGNGANEGASGAGGGGFGSSGGAGGAGVGRTGGNAGQTVPADYVRGGCRGGNGGRSSAGAGGTGGNGGGSVYLISGGMIMIAGEINASGGGGNGGRNKAGGGGGGSGGMIVLDAPTVTVSGTLFANGGGGGEGGGGGNPGADGEDPGDWDEIPDGGEGNGNGGNGGDGAYEDTAAKPGNDVGNGGGGGGGGHGRILVLARSNTLSSKISPSPVITTIP